MIEFLPPREDAFGERQGAAFVGFDGDDDDHWDDEPPRSRWATLVAAVSVFGLLTAGVVAAAPWADDPADGRAGRPTAPSTPVPSGPTPSTSDPSTTPSGAALDPSVTGWLLDPPVAGQRLARLVDPGSDVGPFAAGWGEVWAEPGATRTSGRWVSITLLPVGGASGDVFEPVQAGWFPLVVGERPGRGAVGRDGVVQVGVERDGDDRNHLLTVAGFGFTIQQLADLAGTVTVDGRRPGVEDDRPVLGRPELLAGLERVAAEPTPVDLVDGVLLGPTAGGTAFYAGPDPLDVTMLRERPAGALDPRLAALAFAPGVAGEEPWAFFDGFVPDEYAVGERSVDGYDVRVVRFTTGTSEVWLLTTMSAGVLPAMLDDVRRVTAADWAAARDEAASSTTPAGIDDVAGPPTTIGSGVLADGTSWSVVVTATDGSVEIASDGTLQFRALSSLLGVDRTGALGTIAIGGSLVLVGASAVDGAELRVRSSDDGFVVATSLSDLLVPDEPPGEPGRLDESFWNSWEGTRMTAIAVDQVLPGSPFVAEIVAPDGAVLARLDPWSLGDGA